MALSETEERLVAATTAGEFLDLAGAVDAEVRADVLRDLLRGALGDTPDPRGVRLAGATVTGVLDLSGLHSEVPLALVSCTLPEVVLLAQADLPRLVLSGCTVGRIDANGMRCAGPVVFDGLRCSGGINLIHADIAGGLSLQRARVDSGDAVALCADGLSVAGNVVLTPGFVATSKNNMGTVRLPAARLGGQLRLNHAELSNTGGGSALLMDSAQVTTSIMLTGMTATAASTFAAVQIIRTRTDSMLFLDGVTVDNPVGPALDGRAVQVGAELRLGPGFTAGRGAVLLTGAHVKSALKVESASFAGELDLGEATVDGPLSVPVRELPGPVVVDGLTYRRVPVGASVDEWLELLRRRTPGYAAQPYQQLAAVHRAAGHERDTTRILLAQQRDLGGRGQLGFSARLWHRVSGLLLGYGYRPTRPLAGLLATFVLACVLVFAAGADDTVADKRACRGTEQLAMAADLAIPLVKLGGPTACRFVPEAEGFVVGGWVVTLLGWAFATLFVAGFTGLVRKA